MTPHPKPGGRHEPDLRVWRCDSGPRGYQVISKNGHRLYGPDTKEACLQAAEELKERSHEWLSLQ